MVKEGYKDKGDRRLCQENQERRRRSARKQGTSYLRASSSSSSSLEHEGIIGRTRRDAKLASQKREQESRGTRTRRRPNGGSLSSRGSATGMQCGLCAVLTGLFRRAMCIAGSRRGSGESCYEELATEMQQTQERRISLQQQVQQQLQTEQVQTTCGIGGATASGNNVGVPTSRSESFGSIHRIRETIQAEVSALTGYQIIVILFHLILI